MTRDDANEIAEVAYEKYIIEADTTEQATIKSYLNSIKILTNTYIGNIRSAKKYAKNGDKSNAKKQLNDAKKTLDQIEKDTRSLKDSTGGVFLNAMHILGTADNIIKGFGAIIAGAGLIAGGSTIGKEIDAEFGTNISKGSKLTGAGMIAGGALKAASNIAGRHQLDKASHSEGDGKVTTDLGKADIYMWVRRHRRTIAKIEAKLEKSK